MQRYSVFTVIVALTGLLAAGCNSPSSGAKFQQVASAADLKTRIDAKDAKVINALPEDSFRKNHIPGTVNVPYDRVSEQTLGETKDAPLVFYCAGKGCPVSGMSADRASKLGYRNIWIYEGGLDGWKAAGLPLESGAGK